MLSIARILSIVLLALLYCPSFAVPPARQYPVTAARVIDGDSIETTLSLGFGITIKQQLRIYGIDAPELSTAAGRSVKEYVAKWVGDGGKDLWVTWLGDDKYARRFLGLIQNVETGEYLGQVLLERKMAKPYMGGKKQDWTTEELKAIE